MEKLYKKYYDEICSKISKDMGIPLYKVRRALSSTYEFYRELTWQKDFDNAIKLPGVGKLIPTILSKKMKGILPKSNKNKNGRKNYIDRNNQQLSCGEGRCC